MKIDVQKAISVTGFLLQGAILLLAGGLMGMQNERERLKQQEQAEIVTDIAVVNLDEGIDEQGKRVYYSTDLMDLGTEYYVSENLEAARKGILNGNYAAYVLIPAEFSRNAASINSVPEKAVLEFAINPNLREDVSRLTMANVKNFEISLNTNMTYMYVQALLSEFHDAQDLSGMILENDNTETDRILSIDAKSLLIEPEFEEIEQVEPEMEEIGFEEAFRRNQEVIETLNENYNTSVEKVEEALLMMEEEEGLVIAGIEEFYNVMAEVDVERDADGNLIYENGLSALEDYVKDYNVFYEEQKKKVIDMVVKLTETQDESTEETPPEDGTEGTPPDGGTEETPPEDETESDIPIKTITEIIQENTQNSLTKANEAIENYNAANGERNENITLLIEEIRTVVSSQANEGENGGGEPDEGETNEGEPDEGETNEGETNAGENPGEMTPAIDIAAVLEKLNALKEMTAGFQELPLITLEDVYVEESVLEPFKLLEEEVNKIPKADTEEYTAILEQQVLTPLREETSTENQKIQEAGTAASTKLDEYILKLNELDFSSFYAFEELDSLLVEFEDNIFQLEEKIEETHGEYEEYVYDSIDSANESLFDLKESLEKSYEGTVENINSEVAIAKGNRESMNSINTAILGEFRQKLPYTRIGQLEYVQAYDFMANPIKMSDASIEKDRTIIWQNYDVLRNVLVGLIVLWVVCMCIRMFLQMKSYAADNHDKS